jgi:hypothetical protein
MEARQEIKKEVMSIWANYLRNIYFRCSLRPKIFRWSE